MIRYYKMQYAIIMKTKYNEEDYNEGRWKDIVKRKQELQNNF